MLSTFRTTGAWSITTTYILQQCFCKFNFFISVIAEEDEEGKEDKMDGNSEQDSDQLVSKDALEDKTPNR